MLTATDGNDFLIQLAHFRFNLFDPCVLLINVQHSVYESTPLVSCFLLPYFAGLILIWNITSDLTELLPCQLLTPVGNF